MILKPLVIYKKNSKEIAEILFLTNDGILTSISPFFTVNYKIRLPFTWTTLDIEEVCSSFVIHRGRVAAHQ